MFVAQRADFFQQIGPGADAGDVIARSTAFDEETSYSRRQLICKAKRLLESKPATENMKHAFDHVPGHVRRRQAGVIAGCHHELLEIDGCSLVFWRPGHEVWGVRIGWLRSAACGGRIRSGTAVAANGG